MTNEFNFSVITVGNVRAAGKDLVIQGYQIPKGVNIVTIWETFMILYIFGIFLHLD